jgi:hypothetical protein
MTVFPGQYFQPSASEWNRMLRSSRELPPGKGRRRSENLSYHHDFVWVVNKCGADRDKFDVLKIEEPFITPDDDDDGFRERVVFEGIEPTANCQFAVLLEPALEDALVPALITGSIQARITKVDATIPHCFNVGVAAGEYVLKQMATGSAEAIWSESGTGDKWAFLKLCVHRQVLCKTIAPVPKGTAGNCVCYWGDFPSEFPAGETISGINRFGYIGANKWCIATWLLNHWYIKAAEC